MGPSILSLAVSFLARTRRPLCDIAYAGLTHSQRTAARTLARARGVPPGELLSTIRELCLDEHTAGCPSWLKCQHRQMTPEQRALTRSRDDYQRQVEAALKEFPAVEWVAMYCALSLEPTPSGRCDPSCRGWFTDAESGELQRCDECAVFPDDQAAAEYVAVNRFTCDRCDCELAHAPRAIKNPALCLKCFDSIAEVFK